MATFKDSARLEKLPFTFVSIHDAIEWDKMDISKEEYIQDRDNLVGKVVGDVIKFTLHYPTKSELLYAFGKSGASFNKDGEMVFGKIDGLDSTATALLAMTDQAIELATLCIEKIENLNDCPKNIHDTPIRKHLKKIKKDFHNKKKEYFIPNVVLEEIGTHLLVGSKVSEEEKKQ